MRCSNIPILIAIFIASITLVWAQQDRITVQVYYESLCSDSINFITKQLYPTLQHENLARYVDLELIPYGKSEQTYNNKWNFKCHHGENECYGNKVQICALTLNSKPPGSGFNKETVGFINCLMTKVDKDAIPFRYPTHECASQNNIQNLNTIEQCANGTQGDQALSDAGNLTNNLRPPLKSVPTIIFNRIFSQEDQDSAVMNFQRALCKKIKNRDSIAECQSVNGANYKNPTQLLIGFSTILLTLFTLH